ncbi:MAG: ABC transporter ATP-binding protein [Solirubrobacteraceae bacterium]
MDLLDIDIALPRRTFELRAALTLGNETIALIGPSGAGKTSLLRSIAGLERPRAGHIALAGEVWFDSARRIDLSPERRRVGYLPQDYGLFPHLSVAGNVRFARRRDRPDLLSRVGVAHLSDVRPLELSGGERQRVALARALARDPGLLLLDEPFGALDAITRQQVRHELGDVLASLGLPTLIVTHSFEDATALAQRIGVIDRGRLVQLGTGPELLRDPATVLVAALSGANVVAAEAVPDRAGSLLRLEGGGELRSSAAVTGAVSVVIQPWELALTAREASPLTDEILGVRLDRGRLVVRLTRFTLHADPGAQNAGTIIEGRRVGLQAAPDDVRVIAAAG